MTVQPYSRELILCFVVHAFAIPALASANSVQIDAEKLTGSDDLAVVLKNQVARLSSIKAPAHEIVLSGHFAPVTTVRVNWFSNTTLTISAGQSGATIDGKLLHKGSETLFVAGQNITVGNLDFVNSQGHAIVVGGNSNNYEVADCSFTDCQQGAIHVWNDPHTITKDQNIRGKIIRNSVQRFNLANAKWSNDGITVFDQRVLIADNLIVDSRTETNGIRAMGRELTIEGNRVKGVSVDDSGGIYLWGGPHASLFRGNTVRRNHISGASRGIYLDDGTSGATVVENVIEDSAVCSIFLSGGRDNLIHRNAAIGSPVFLHLDSRCLGWDSRPEYAALAEESLERLRRALSDDKGGLIIRKQYRGLEALELANLSLTSLGQPRDNHVHDNFIKNVDETWELMDFSTSIDTDFAAINQFETPKRFSGQLPIDLQVAY